MRDGPAAGARTSGRGYPLPMDLGSEVMRILGSLWKDRRGATAIEYALIASLISVGALAGYQALGNKVGSGYSNVEQALTAAI